MTTAHMPSGTGSSPGIAGRVVRRAVLATLALGAVLTVVAAVVGGSPAVLGVVVGIALVAGFFGLGTVVLIWVTRVSPAASLLVSLLTYTLQVVVLAIAFVALQASGLLESTIDPGWLGGTVIAGTIVWLSIQVTLTLRTRQLYYDLPSDQSLSSTSGTASDGRSGGSSGADQAGAP
jgi:ATP synthase protein I